MLLYIARKNAFEMYRFSDRTNNFEPLMLRIDEMKDCSQPLSVINNQVLYTRSKTQPNAIVRISLKEGFVKTLNVGVHEPMAVYRVPIDHQKVNQPQGTTFDLVIGANARQDAVVLCNVPS